MREHLLDEAFDRYLDWRAESEAVAAAYGRWWGAAAAEGADSFAAYRAALDREERAASLYGTLLARITHMFDADLESARAASGAPRV